MASDGCIRRLIRPPCASHIAISLQASASKQLLAILHIQHGILALWIVVRRQVNQDIPVNRQKPAPEPGVQMQPWREDLPFRIRPLWLLQPHPPPGEKAGPLAAP